MQAKDAINIAELRALAAKRVPRVLFEFMDGASEDERALALNLRRLREYSLVARQLRGIAHRSQTTELFGKTYASSFGIAPMGSIGVLGRGIEFSLSDAAKQANIPMILSGAGSEPLETVAPRAPEQIWSQLYAAEDPNITADLVKRAKDCGAGALVWTVDVAVPAKNDRALRNGFGHPLRLSLKSKLEALTHVRWMAEYLQGGMVRMGQWERYVEAGARPERVRQFFLSQRNSSQNWRDVERLRGMWTGPFIIKGILHPDDAVHLAELGVDGVIVSNHGGFGLDRAPASIDMLADVVAAVGDKLVVMYDGGVRRGSDIIVARCLGAKFVFAGRAVLFGAVAGGKQGASRAIDILMNEMDRTMGQLGCKSAYEFNPSFVRQQ